MFKIKCPCYRFASIRANEDFCSGVLPGHTPEYNLIDTAKSLRLQLFSSVPRYVGSRSRCRIEPHIVPCTMTE